MYRLSRKEMRIIEQTRHEGEELQRQQEAEGVPRRKCVGMWSMLLFVLIFLLFAFGMRLLTVMVFN